MLDHGIELEGDTGLVVVLGGSGPDTGGVRKTPRTGPIETKGSGESKVFGSGESKTGFFPGFFSNTGFFPETAIGRSAATVTAFNPGNKAVADSLIATSILGATVTPVCTICPASASSALEAVIATFTMSPAHPSLMTSASSRIIRTFEGSFSTAVFTSLQMSAQLLAACPIALSDNATLRMMTNCLAMGFKRNAFMTSW